MGIYNIKSCVLICARHRQGCDGWLRVMAEVSDTDEM